MTVVSRCVLSLGRSTTRLAGSRRVLSRSLASLKSPASLFSPLDTFHERHIGPDDAETAKMLRRLGYMKMNTFIGDTVPPNVTVQAHHVDMPALSESQLHERVKELAAMNKPFKSYIGMGYHNAVVPPVILRNVSSVALIAFSFFNTFAQQVMENPAWYTPYTPYQPEIAQGISIIFLRPQLE